MAFAPHYFSAAGATMAKSAVKHHLSYSNAITSLAKETQKRFSRLVSHPVEKGRVLEHIAVNFLRRFIPSRYSLGYGFIVTADGQQSRQIDIVIYDNVDNVPIFLSDTIGIFPVESVFAAIEVKTQLGRSELRSSIASIRELRTFKTSKRYLFYTERSISGKTNRFEEIEIPISPRTYIFAYDTKYKSASNLRDAIVEEYGESITHIHGVYVLKKNWFIAQKANTIPPVFFVHEQQGTKKFIINLIKRLRELPMAPAAMERYFQAEEE